MCFCVQQKLTQRCKATLTPLPSTPRNTRDLYAENDICAAVIWKKKWWRVRKKKKKMVFFPKSGSINHSCYSLIPSDSVCWPAASLLFVPQGMLKWKWIWFLIIIFMSSPNWLFLWFFLLIIPKHKFRIHWSRFQPTSVSLVTNLN